jgi:hypothetical protein
MKNIHINNARRQDAESNYDTGSRSKREIRLLLLLLRIDRKANLTSEDQKKKNRNSG